MKGRLILLMVLGGMMLLPAHGDSVESHVGGISDSGMQDRAETVVDEGDRSGLSPAGERLAASMAEGFVKAIRRESVRWYECGQETPFDGHRERAEKISRGILKAMKGYGVKDISPWAALAVIFSESRGDQCAIGPYSRRAARNMGLVSPDKLFNTWSREDVESVITSPVWNRSRSKVGADLGLGQDVWKRYARVIDDAGSERCGGARCRVPTLDEILSVEGGTRVVVTGLIYRAKLYRTNKPWAHWPGSIRDTGYESKIGLMMSVLGRPSNRREVWW